MKHAPLRVLILFNLPTTPADDPEAESDSEVVWTSEAIETCLRAAGFVATREGIGRDPQRVIDVVRRERPDVVFNLFEGLADRSESEAQCAGLLEWLGVPFTGSPSRALALARSKPLTKHVLRGAGLPTADFFVADGEPLTKCPLPWPVIVKLAEEDASLGLDQGSVVQDLVALNARIAHLCARYGAPVMVEEFVHGRELSVGLIALPELRTLPACEIVFDEREPGAWPIVTYDAKWNPGTRDYEATPPLYPAPLDADLAQELARLAEQAFEVLGCRDYARVDFRVRSDGTPCILEVNPNPDLSPIAGLAGQLTSAGLSHSDLVVGLVRAAAARGRH
jgi:D-alanine-D-alanine ligase